MKCIKLFSLALALLLALASAARFTRAFASSAEEEYGYARITADDTYLYSSAEEDSGLFILPRSYFVKVTGAAGSYYAVEYMSGIQGRTPVRGYCLAEELTLVDYIPETPFLNYTVRVTFRVGDSLPDSFISEYEVDAAFYGTFSYGSAVCYYVELDGEFGYVPASACPPLDYPLNTEHTEQEEPETDVTPARGGFGALNIVLICVLAVVALGAVYFLFRPAKKRRPDGEDAEDVF